MKIRHKQSGVELEGDFVRVSESYLRMPLSIPHGGSCYAASEWEAVPEWVDVTGACELNGAVSCMVMCGGVEITIPSSQGIPVTPPLPRPCSFEPSPLIFFIASHSLLMPCAPR